MYFATKIRALFQSSKGRDLFDFWLLATEVGIDKALVLDAFKVYRPIGYTAKRAIENLEVKISNTGFLSDINNLISPKIDNYCPDVAAQLIINDYLQNI